MVSMSPTGAARRLTTIVAMAIMALAALWLSAADVLAQTDSATTPPSPVESSTPAIDAVLDAPPTQVQLTFTEPFGAGVTAEQIGLAISCGGTPLGLGPKALGPDGRTVLAPITQIAPGGPCAVSWRLPDGRVGTFEFTVRGTFTSSTTPGATTAPDLTVAPGGSQNPTTPASGMLVDPADVTNEIVVPGGFMLAIGRWLAQLGLVAVLGTVVLVGLAWPEGIDYPDTVRFLRNAYFLAVIGVLITAWQTTAELTGRSTTSALSPVAWANLLDEAAGRPVIARLVITLGLGWIVVRPVRVVEPATQLASLALPALAVATYGFSRSGVDGTAVVWAVASVHALAMAVWLGGLAVVARVVLARPGDDDLIYALRGYAKLATPATVIAVVSGVVLSQRLVDGELFSTRHGRWILLKALLVAAMVYLGVLGRRRWRRRLNQAEVLERRLAAPMRRALSTELLIGLLVLGATVGLAASRPATMQPSSPASQYPYDTLLTGEGFRVRLSMTPLIAGPQGLRVEVLEPTELEALRIKLQPAEVPTAPGWEIDVPLQTDGAAVLRLAQGWRLDVPGVWTIDVTARGPLGLLPTLSTSVVIADPLAADG